MTCILYSGKPIWNHSMPNVLTNRKSEEKVVVDKEVYDKFIIPYLTLIEALSKEYKVKLDNSFTELVNFKTNKLLPIHNWFDYKQGYADGLVRRLIEVSKIDKDDYILDPFNGVGTTQVTSQKLGIKSVGLDINPVANFAAKVKTTKYSDNDKKIIGQTLTDISNYYKKTKRVPKYKKINEIFTPQQLVQILNIKGFYESIDSTNVRDFFKLAYLSIIEDISNRVKDGNGIKIARTKKPIIDVYKYYELKCHRMLSELPKTKSLPDAKIIDGSILDDKVYEKLKKLNIGGVIYSPPYANCFDYLEVYKMEVWLGDFVNDYEDFVKFRSVAIRSHVNSKFSKIIKHKNAKVEVISSLIGAHNIWNKNIPSMLLGYFDDMHEVIRRTYEISREGSLCAIVVANSGYKGVIVPTDLLLADIANQIGYKVEEILLAREIRASSQQMALFKGKNSLMRESIIILRK